MKGCIQQWVCFALEFRHSRTNHREALVPQLKAFEARFGNELDPSSLAADWENHSCFLFLRWVICLSSAGSPTALRSVNVQKFSFWEKKMLFLYKTTSAKNVVFVGVFQSVPMRKDTWDERGVKSLFPVLFPHTARVFWLCSLGGVSLKPV